MEAKKEEANKSIISLSELNILEKKQEYSSKYYYHHFEEVKKNEKLDTPIKTEEYYEFDEKQNKELDFIFKQQKTKLKSFKKHGFLKKGKLYNISNDTFNIYNERIDIINKIKLESGHDIISAIELNNNDLIILSRIENPDNDEEMDNSYYELLIYRKKDNDYLLFQKIKENINGYGQEYYISGMDDYPKRYYINFIKEISGNRFFLVSNYGFKIYSLNEKNEFILTLKTYHSETIKSITEINENKFIFCTDFSDRTTLGGPAYNEFIMELIELEKITEEKLKEEGIKTLKFSEKTEKILYYTSHRVKRYFTNCIILKNKYYVILLDFIYILLFDFNGELLKRYKITKKEEKKLDFIKYYERDVNIQKWDCNEENKFLYLIDDNIFLIELNEDENENIAFNIIGHSSFTSGKDLTKINDTSNEFYSSDKKNECIYLYLSD